MKCVVCNSEDHELILNLNCGGFDNSPLYEKLNVLCCKTCGHIFNHLSDKDIAGLKAYYDYEYSQCNLESPNKNGDTPGSSSAASLQRYSAVFKLISSHLECNTKLLDVGCANGGFLKYVSALVNKENLYGVEPTERFAETAKQVTDNIFCTDAEHLLFEDQTLDIVIADQVVEHLVDPNIFFAEAKRVLKDTGKLCISVPCANDYVNKSFFDFYFFLMREHVQHFGVGQLARLARKHGFVLDRYNMTFPNLISEVGTLPNLTMVFKQAASLFERAEVTIRELSLVDIRKYILQSYNNMLNRVTYVDYLIDKFDSISVYGMSREFHYLWSNTNLSKCKNIQLFDDIKTKQNMTVDGIPIFSSDCITKEANVLITSFAHTEVMTQNLIQKGFKGNFI